MQHIPHIVFAKEYQVLSKILKSNLSKKKITFGSWISIPHLSVVEIMAMGGFEWLVIDMEHTSTNLETCMQTIQVIQSKNIDALVRVPQNEEVVIKKVMDSGATGVIVPMIKNAKEAQKAVSLVKYPPIGVRGIGLYRAQGYGVGFNEYKEWVNQNSVVIVQIEHIEAVENIDKILQVEGVDGVLIGPYDLSASIGYAGEFEHPKMIQATNKVIEATKKSTKSLGFHIIPPDPLVVRKRIEEGYNFLAFSIDFLFLLESIKEKFSPIKEIR